MNEPVWSRIYCLPEQNLEERSLSAISRRLVADVLTLAILGFVITAVVALIPVLQPGFYDLVCPYSGIRPCG